MARENPPTLQDVARRAGASTASVSRYLNKTATLRPALRERIEEAVSALGYVPHGAARALASRRSHSLGAVFPTLDNAIFARGIEALQKRLDAADYTLLLAASDYDAAQELKQVRALVSRGVDGLVLVGLSHAPAVYDLLEAKGLPMVNTWAFESAGRVPAIGFDNRAAARRLCGHLLDLGHRRIAMIAGVTAGNDRASDRVAGVREALAARGLALTDDTLIERPYDIGEGRRALRILMAQRPQPTAVICGNDVLAFGVLFEAAALGIPVPAALSVTGFDDLDLASHMVPPLTTMRVPSEAMGRRAAEHLLARLAGVQTDSAVELEVELIVRGSTGPAPA